MLHPARSADNRVCVPVQDVEAVAGRVAPFGIGLDAGEPDGCRAGDGADVLLFGGGCPGG